MIYSEARQTEVMARHNDIDRIDELEASKVEVKNLVRKLATFVRRQEIDAQDQLDGLADIEAELIGLFDKQIEWIEN